MANRQIFAIITVDDEKAFEENDMGPVEYAEREFGWLEQSGIGLEEMIMAESDSSSIWERYINYLLGWAFEHSDDEETTESPLPFNVWKARTER